MSRIRLRSTVLDSPDPVRHARFYADLLGWQVANSDPEWSTVLPVTDNGESVEGDRGLAFQPAPGFVAPVWPAEPGQQRMHAHLDFLVDDLEGAWHTAEKLGARRHPVQIEDDCLVCVDPFGQFFCLFE